MAPSATGQRRGGSGGGAGAGAGAGGGGSAPRAAILDKRTERGGREKAGEEGEGTGRGQRGYVIKARGSAAGAGGSLAHVRRDGPPPLRHFPRPPGLGRRRIGLERGLWRHLPAEGEPSGPARLGRRRSPRPRVSPAGAEGGQARHQRGRTGRGRAVWRPVGFSWQRYQLIVQMRKRRQTGHPRGSRVVRWAEHHSRGQEDPRPELTSDTTLTSCEPMGKSLTPTASAWVTSSHPDEYLVPGPRWLWGRSEVGDPHSPPSLNTR
ncbi:uncharacterized protein [Notamacropus eugenii]|uniref:uncharacterized protein n=1 Tax=Notamacropus eugenii TaxID=9315 RepID=UPI003B6834DC